MTQELTICFLGEQNLFAQGLALHLNQHPNICVINEITLEKETDRTEDIIFLFVRVQSTTLSTIKEKMSTFINARCLLMRSKRDRKHLADLFGLGVNIRVIPDTLPPNVLLHLLFNLKADSEVRLKHTQKLISSREVEVLRLFTTEKTTGEIARALRLSIRTVETSRKGMIERMQCRNMIGVMLSVLGENHH